MYMLRISHIHYYDMYIYIILYRTRERVRACNSCATITASCVQLYTLCKAVCCFWFNVFVYMYTHVHVGVYIHIYIHVYLRIYIWIYIYIKMCVYIYTYIYIYIYICIYMYIYIYMNV